MPYTLGYLECFKYTVDKLIGTVPSDGCSILEPNVEEMK